MTLQRNWFRRHCNRALCLQMLSMLLIALVWFLMQVLPVLPKPGEPELFFGEPHVARQSILFGRVSFRIHGDNNATFVVWMNPANRERFDSWFGPDQPLRIDALRTWGSDWLVIGLGTSSAELEARELVLWRVGWLMGAMVFLALGIALFLWLLREYFRYFRHRPWFRVG